MAYPSSISSTIPFLLRLFPDHLHFFESSELKHADGVRFNVVLQELDFPDLSPHCIRTIIANSDSGLSFTASTSKGHAFRLKQGAVQCGDKELLGSGLYPFEEDLGEFLLLPTD